MFKSIVRAIVVAVGIATAVVVSGLPATAQVDALTCVSSTDVQYKPGLLLTPQEVKIEVDGELLTCVDTSGQQITAGTYGAKLKATRSCADLLAPTTGTFTINWNNGTQGFSTISFSRTATIVGGNIVTTETGTVVAGDFLGHSTLFVTVGANLLVQCLAPPGLTDLHTNGDLTIV